jgi:hypothetical protein
MITGSQFLEMQTRCSRGRGEAVPEAGADADAVECEDGLSSPA